MNNDNNSHKLTAQRFLHRSGSDAQRPLIDVARLYGKNLNQSTSMQNNEIKENLSSPASSFNSPVYPSQGNPYTWKAKTDSGNKTTIPTSRPTNPYSWKALSATKTHVTGSPSSENTLTNDPSFPRPPRIPLPKLEPLTVSISKDSDSRTVVSEIPQQQGPLQPFSPTSNSRDCTCLRNPKVILCHSCGHIQKGRLSMACTVHPRQVFLMDINCCSSCKSTNLKEICDAKK